MWLPRTLIRYPHIPCISYAKAPNSHGPCAYCSLDKAADAQVQNEEIPR